MGLWTGVGQKQRVIHLVMRHVGSLTFLNCGETAICYSTIAKSFLWEATEFVFQRLVSLQALLTGFSLSNLAASLSGYFNQPCTQIFYLLLIWNHFLPPVLSGCKPGSFPLMVLADVVVFPYGELEAESCV